MYRSMKKHNRFHLPGGGTMKATPLSSGRESSLPSTDEAELNAISTAQRKGKPLYFVRTDDGVTLDVLLSKTDALKRRDSAIHRTHNGLPRIKVYERVGTNLMRVG
jgi:hypothetical protein